MQLDPSAFVADPELVKALEKRATPVPCTRDIVLFRQGEVPTGLHILHKGEATLTMNSEDGAPLTASKAKGGSLLGLPGLIANQPYSLGAMAHAGAQISFVSRNDFTALMQSDPQLSLKILQVLAAEVRSARMAITQQ